MRTLTKKFLLATFLALSMEVSAKASMVTMTLRNVTVKDAIVDLQKTPATRLSSTPKTWT